MVRILSRYLACAAVVLVAACRPEPPPEPAVTRLDGTTIEISALTDRIESLTRTAKVHGLTVAVFNDAKVVYSHAFGSANVPAGTPLRTDTEVYGASLSKAVLPCGRIAAKRGTRTLATSALIRAIGASRPG
jgi:CubicO group peptidase (beta-lactamase class C family)